MKRFAQIFVLSVLGVMLLRACVLTNVAPGTVGVRYNNALGLLEEDLAPGWHWEVTGLQRIWRLPARYLFINYTGTNALSIRTKDNNTVNVDVSVPYRIIPGKAHSVMDAGNHLSTGTGQFRFERLANDTTISVLREQLAQLKSQDFYNTDRRLRVAKATLDRLNGALKPLNLQTNAVLIRAAYFRRAYENQLARIQLNEQQKLLDGAKELVAKEQQKLDNYNQQTNALVSMRQQDWARRIAELARAYQVGFVDSGDDRAPGAARRKLAAMDAEARKALVTKAALAMGIVEAKAAEAHLLGVENVKAETTEYNLRVRAAAAGIAARLRAEGQAKVAKVKGLFEAKLNALLNTRGGRAYVAYRAADNVKFDSRLTFQSSDGIPAILRLGNFARQFMGK